MNTGFIYPEIIAEIRTACLRHVKGLASAEEVQRVIQRGEMAIVAIEEKDIRNFLTNMEGRLELIKFTLDDDRQLAESRKLAEETLLWLSERESGKG